MTTESRPAHHITVQPVRTVQIRWANGLPGWLTVSDRSGVGLVPADSDLARALETCAVGDVIVMVLRPSRGADGVMVERHAAFTVTHLWGSGAAR